MRKLKKYGLILGTSALLFSCGEKKEVVVESIRPVKYIKVTTSNLTGSHTYSGLAKAEEEASLSFRVSGTVNNRLAKVGDRVKKGQLLMTLDDTDYRVSYSQSAATQKSNQAQIKNYQAQVKSAEANYLAAKSNYARYEKLYETNSVSLNDFEQTKANYEAAFSSYNAAKSQTNAARAQAAAAGSATQSAQNQIQYTQLRAPFTGVISQVSVEQNEAVGQGAVVMVISSETNPEIEVGVPEIGIAQINKDQEVKVQFSVIPDKTFVGKVYEVGYSSSGSTYPVTIRLIDGDSKIRPGMPADVSFEFLPASGNQDIAIVVPPGSVGEDDKGHFVYTLEKVDEKKVKAKRTSIVIGSLSDKGFEVKEGLKEGQLVAAAGLNVLRDGVEAVLFEDQATVK